MSERNYNYNKVRTQRESNHQKKKKPRTHPSYEELVRDQGRFGNRVGRAGEVRVLKAFRIPGSPDWYTSGVRQANREEDQHGIDFWVATDAGEIPLQVKMKMLSNNRSCKHRYPGIPVVLLHLDDSDSEIRSRIFRAVTPFYIEKKKKTGSV